MFLTRQDATYGIVALPLLFLAGASIAYVAAAPSTVSITVMVLCYVSAFVLAFSYRIRTNNGSEASQYRLRLRAYEHVVQLTSSGYDMLVPCDSHTETARLLICMEGDVAVIKKETWRGAWHFYAISPDGELKLEIWGIGAELTDADREWLNGPLTPERLHGLVTALGSTYSPRQRVTAAP